MKKGFNLNLQDANIWYYPNFFTEQESKGYFNLLKTQTQWQQDNITVFGKTYKQPRLTALYGNKSYTYSNIIMYPSPFTYTLNTIKSKINDIEPRDFNACLLNLYRDGEDSNGWHADNEKELGNNPVIASLSFGASRMFHLKHRFNSELKHKFVLENGSLLIMKGTTQHNWLHQIPKTKKKIEARINLTFRIIK